ncbi:hypothetical protein K0U27_06295 [archaeon]|nr:hypothetical protein [archaeon]
MRVVDGQTRIMRDEYEKIGITKDTNEIRESFDLDTMRSVIAYMPEDEIQHTHMHSIIIEAIHVIAGQLDVWNNGVWKTIPENNIVMFQHGEYHNLRTSKKSKEISLLSADSGVAAITLAYKWIPPNLKIFQDEIETILDNDWFHLDYVHGTEDATTSPLLRTSNEIQEKFMNILKRNNLQM